MPSVSETSGASLPLAAGLALGVETLSGNQSITFTKYVRLVLPLDGYVFWVRADLLSQSALLGASRFGSTWFGRAQSIVTPAATVAVSGSFHYASDQRQNEDETPAVHRVLFTATDPIEDFNQIAPDVMFIGTFDGIRFAFNQRNSYYQQAGLHHYAGTAIYPAMASQIIDAVQGFDSRNVVVSNSLPVWLSLNQIMPMYPSFLVPANLPPVYAAVHVMPESTRALQSAPSFDARLSHYQLVSERVRITMYGLRNFNALDFQDYVYQYMLDDRNLFGLMNMPIVRDEKRTQSELNIIAMKKSIDFEVSYYQTRVNDVARQLILSAIPTFYAGAEVVT